MKRYFRPAPFGRTGDKNALTPEQLRGLALFKGKAHCIQCHAFSPSAPFFTDFKFHNTGIAMKGRLFEQLGGRASEISDPRTPNATAGDVLAHSENFSDFGYLVTKQPKDVGAFKTPTLRDNELTTPYMHDGSEKTLLDVVRFYNKGGEKNPNLDERIRPLGLTDEEMNDLVEFMRALTSDDVLRQAQQTKPQNRSPVMLPAKQHHAP